MKMKSRMAAAALVALICLEDGRAFRNPAPNIRAAKIRTVNDAVEPPRNAAAARRPSDARSRRDAPMTLAASTFDDDESVGEWIPLVDASENDETPAPVRKRVLEEGGGDLPPTGSTVELQYAGTLLSKGE